MDNYRESDWKRYKADFLRFNRCTADEFEASYIAFMQSKPNTKAYRHFARKYSIAIIPEPRLPYDLQVRLSVDISALKVIAKTFEECENAMRDILGEHRTPKH